MSEDGKRRMMREMDGVEDDDGRKSKIYPAPLRSHEEIVSNASLFVEALRSFHMAMSTRFMVPVIGGKDLDLHLLYVKVTSMGGVQKVIAEKRWKEIIYVFGFPATTTSASFVLRKYYLSLLYHFEQVYFFRAQGPVMPPSVAPQSKASINKRKSDSIGVSPCTMSPRESKKARSDIRDGSFDIPIKGRINGKCELGYFVTVKIGEQTLKGLLYHPSELTPAGSYSATDSDDNMENNDSSKRSGGGRRSHRNWHPDHPKPNRSAYNFFFKEKHAELKLQHSNAEKDLIKMISKAWNKLTKEERAEYDEVAKADKERYGREMQEFKHRLKQY